MELVPEVVKLVTAILLLVAAALKILSTSKADGSGDDTGETGRNPKWGIAAPNNLNGATQHPTDRRRRLPLL